MASVALPPIGELNERAKSDPVNFFKVVNILFETAPPLASSLIKKSPFQSYDQLIDEAVNLIEGMNLSDKLEVINAHPRIGTKPTAAELSPLSYKEQGYQQEHNFDQQKLKKVYEELELLNQQYEQKFGFKFIVFVNGRTKEQILPVLKDRLQNNSTEHELKTGIDEMVKIARNRLSNIQVQPKL